MDQDHHTSPWTVQLLDNANVQHFLEMGFHIIVCMGGICWEHSLKGVQSVNLIWCFMRDIFPRSRSLWENRCSHLTSSFLAWSHSSSCHSSRPWRFSSSRIQSFWGSQAGSPEAPTWRATSDTQLAGATLPTTTLVGITKGWALRFHKQIGT